MAGLSGSEWLLYGGITVMAVTAVLSVIGIIVYIRTGRKLKEKLEQEYGK